MASYQMFIFFMGLQISISKNGLCCALLGSSWLCISDWRAATPWAWSSYNRAQGQWESHMNRVGMYYLILGREERVRNHTTIYHSKYSLFFWILENLVNNCNNLVFEYMVVVFIHKSIWTYCFLCKGVLPINTIS